jgi:2-amino-4-hydroxy-6-hydroxymethyldihydropteridine diphosphokinase
MGILPLFVVCLLNYAGSQYHFCRTLANWDWQTPESSGFNSARTPDRKNTGENMNHIVYLALGTNIGDRAENFRAALSALESFIEIKECSPIYETPPWGYTDQPPFLNQVLKAVTDLSPTDLLIKLKQIESDLGRTPSVRYGPRLIDIDLLFYDDLVLETERLIIPHPRMRGRAFVLVPLADIASDFMHPGNAMSVLELLGETDREGIRLFTTEID